MSQQPHKMFMDTGAAAASTYRPSSRSASGHPSCGSHTHLGWSACPRTCASVGFPNCTQAHFLAIKYHCLLLIVIHKRGKQENVPLGP
eukprot:1155993-Pelagomonas_calceolata.AAC.3